MLFTHNKPLPNYGCHSLEKKEYGNNLNKTNIPNIVCERV